jgi:hypothetical protein
MSALDEVNLVEWTVFEALILTVGICQVQDALRLNECASKGEVWKNRVYAPQLQPGLHQRTARYRTSHTNAEPTELPTWWVALNGNDSNDTPGTMQQPFKSLARAVKASRDHTHKIPTPGSHHTAQAMTKRIVMRGGWYFLQGCLKMCLACF